MQARSAHAKRKFEQKNRLETDDGRRRESYFTSPGSHGRRKWKGQQGWRGSSCIAPRRGAAPPPWSPPWNLDRHNIRKEEERAVEVASVVWAAVLPFYLMLQLLAASSSFRAWAFGAGWRLSLEVRRTALGPFFLFF